MENPPRADALGDSGFGNGGKLRGEFRSSIVRLRRQERGGPKHVSVEIVWSALMLAVYDDRECRGGNVSNAEPVR